MAKRAGETTKPHLRVGFIGAGGIAAHQMRELAGRRDITLAALADVRSEAVANLADIHEVAGRYTDYKQMLRLEKLDAVSVCTPNMLHAAPTIAALKAGCHVMCEKPLAMNAREGARMVQAARNAGRELIIGFQYRFSPRTTFIREAVDAGEFGQILYGRVQALRRRGIPNWGVFGQKELQGGGPLIDIGVHALEMAHYAMGSPTPVSASADMFTYLGNRSSGAVRSAWAGWDHKSYNVEDLAVGRIRFDTGAVIHLEASFAAHIKEDFWNFQLMGEKAGATWNPPQVFTDEGGHMINKSPAWLANDSTWIDLFRAKMNNFADHLLYGEPTLAPAEDGLAVQQMLDALYASAEKGGREVTIQPMKIKS